MNTSCCARSRLGVHAFCCALIVGLGSLLAFNQQARANVFAAHLETSATSWNFQSGPITFSYRLNQPATSVNIEIYRAADPNTVIRTITNCPTARGLNQVSWDGTDDLGNQVPAGNDYKFRVIAVRSATPAAHGSTLPRSPTESTRSATPSLARPRASPSTANPRAPISGGFTFPTRLQRRLPIPGRPRPATGCFF